MPDPQNPVVAPRLTAAEITALGTPEDGWIVWNTDADELQIANGGTFAAVGGGSGAPTTADYLVGTANGGLSAEIVVGTSPGGELGGTWASPTVDATHSGSTHAATQAAAEATAAAALAAHEADTTSVHGIADTALLADTSHAADHRVAGSDALFVRLQAVNSSTSTSAGTSFCSITAAADTELLFWTAWAGQTTTASTQVTVTITYSDATTTSLTTTANQPETVFANAGGLAKMRSGAYQTVTANSAKAVTKIDILTAGAGSGTRVGIISAVQVPL